jgi:amino acid transporter
MGLQTGTGRRLLAAGTIIFAAIGGVLILILPTGVPQLATSVAAVVFIVAAFACLMGAYALRRGDKQTPPE